jgi:hypothetical protein
MNDLRYSGTQSVNSPHNNRKVYMVGTEETDYAETFSNFEVVLIVCMFKCSSPTSSSPKWKEEKSMQSNKGLENVTCLYSNVISGYWPSHRYAL